MTHDELVQKSAKWLKKHSRNAVVPNCSIIVSEAKSSCKTGEIPDVIGWGDGKSILMEIKVSRSDFLKDFNKNFRLNPCKGAGQFRYYVCPNGIIKPDEIQTTWGLITYKDGEFIIIKKAIKQDMFNTETERDILLSILRRMA